MSDLLYLQASPRARSQSRAIADDFLAAWRARHPDADVDVLDLWAEPLPRFDGAALDAKYAILGKRPHTPAQAQAWAAIETAVARLAAAKRLLLAVPMWNFGVPYVLKHYIDVVTQPTLSFAFSPEAGYRGLLRDRRALVVYASGGDYLPGSGNPRPDLQKPFVETWLRFIGIDDIATVAVQPTIGDPTRLDASIAQARERVRALAERF